MFLLFIQIILCDDLFVIRGRTLEACISHPRSSNTDVGVASQQAKSFLMHNRPFAYHDQCAIPSF